MRYTSGIPYLFLIVASLISSILATALITLAVATFNLVCALLSIADVQIEWTEIDITGTPGIVMMGVFFLVVFIVLAFFAKATFIQLEKGRILYGQKRKTEKPISIISTADIDFTELMGGEKWRIYAIAGAEGEYIKHTDPVRHAIKQFLISDYKGLTIEIVRDFCTMNGVAIKEFDWKWEQIERVELGKRSIKIQYSLKRKFLWKENVVARHKDIQSVELLVHDRAPGKDYYVIHLKNGKCHEFGYDYLWQRYDEMRKYTDKNRISFRVTQV